MTMPKTTDTTRRWRVPAEWPCNDRELWLARHRADDELRLPRYGDCLQPTSIVTIERCYGRYLAFLDQTHELLPEEPPGDRATPKRLAAYLCHLTSLGYRSRSIICAISGLRSAIRILDPFADTSWIWRPNGASLVSRLRGPRKTFNVPEIAVLYEWGQSLIAEARASRGMQNDLLQVRDGLMISMFACRPIRRRTMAGLLVGQHLVKHGHRWQLILAESDMKNSRAIEVHLPEQLTPDIDYYLEEVRPKLKGVQPTQAMWIGRDGRALSVGAISSLVWKKAEAKFGEGFGPHRFRHAYATSAINHDPRNPGIAAAVLAIGATMVEKHYNIGNTVVASRILGDAIREERAESRASAKRHFQRGRRSS